MALTKLRKPCCSYGIEAKADEHPQRGNIDKYWSVRAKNSVSVKVPTSLRPLRNFSEIALPSMLRITFDNKVLNNRRHHQRCTAQKEIACQKDHVVKGVLVRHAKDQMINTIGRIRFGN